MDQATSAIMGSLFLSGVAADGPDLMSVDEGDSGYVSREQARVVPEILELFASVDENQDGEPSSESARAARQLQG